MTRDQRLAEQERKRAERPRQDRRRLTATRRERRALADEARAQRRKRTGLQADEHGWFVWDEGTVEQLLALVPARLAHVPNPVAVLEALLGEVEAVCAPQAQEDACLLSGIG